MLLTNYSLFCPPHYAQQRTKRAAATLSKESFCSSCICELVKVYGPAFQASGLTLGGASQAPFSLEKAAGVVTSCTTKYFAE